MHLKPSGLRSQRGKGNLPPFLFALRSRAGYARHQQAIINRLDKSRRGCIMKNMKRLLPVLLLLLLFAVPAFAVDVAPRISDREIIESLAELKAGQKTLQRQLNDMKESIDKRFEQVDKRFEQQLNFLWILASIFTAFTVSVIAFAWWDRRTIIARAKAETIAEIEKEGKVKDLINALRKLSSSDAEVAKVLKQFNLL